MGKVDLLFVKGKPTNKKSIDFEEFLSILDELAYVKRITKEELENHLIIIHKEFKDSMPPVRSKYAFQYPVKSTSAPYKSLKPSSKPQVASSVPRFPVQQHARHFSE